MGAPSGRRQKRSFFSQKSNVSLLVYVLFWFFFFANFFLFFIPFFGVILICGLIWLAGINSWPAADLFLPSPYLQLIVPSAGRFMKLHERDKLLR